MRSIMAGGLRLALGVEREESARIRRILGGAAANGQSIAVRSPDGARQRVIRVLSRILAQSPEVD
jgi:hypothetical protein